MSRDARLIECPVDRIGSLLPTPAPDANKYTRGKLVVVGGDGCYPGSICLLAQAAYRMGAGYVEAFCDAATVPILQARVPSAVVRKRSTLDDASLADAASQGSRHPCAIALGSGMDGGNEDDRRLACWVIEAAACPLVVDGGALAALATAAGQHARASRPSSAGALVLTPHLGEAARLAHGASITVPEGSDPAALASFASDLAEAYGACVILKGPDTYLAAAGADEVMRMGLGTAALAKAGTGDVLAGMVGALLAQGLAAMDAALVASVLHAEAGRLAAADLGPISVMAEDVIERIAAALMQAG